MATYRASVVLHAPLEQTYEFFSRFTDFPKFLDFIEAITYHDRLRSNWIADIVGDRAWIAANEQWITGQEITWRSTGDLQITSKIMFESVSSEQTRINLVITYQTAQREDRGELLGATTYIEYALQYDLNQFAMTLNQSASRLIDPESPLYLLQGDIMANHVDTTNQ